VIIDATKPVGLPFPELAEPPKELWQKINLKEYIKEHDSVNTKI
jgi:hypothetical protein